MPRPILTPCLLALVVGCQAKPGPKVAVKSAIPSPSEIAVLSNTDPSAMKLHDISGALLAYHAIHKQLPETFEQLQEVADIADGPIDAKIPGTDLSYVYTRDGIYLQDLEQWIVVYEPAPLHSGSRAIVTINRPKPFEALQTKVIAVPEPFFLLHPPTPGGATPKPQ